MSQFTQEQVRALELCSGCPRLCHFSCPSAHGAASEEATAWAMMSLANAERAGQLALDADISRAVYRCASCLRCRSFCKHGNDVPDALRVARERAVEARLEPAAIVELGRELEGALHRDLLARASALLDLRQRTASAALHLTATWLTSDERVTRLRRLVGLLELMAGETFSLWLEPLDASSGAVAARAGLRGLALRQAASLSERSSKVKRVVSDCPDTVVALGERGEHLIAFLARHAAVLRSRTSKLPRESVTWHGGCRERRVLDLTELERTVFVAAGGEPDAILDLRGEPECCGGEAVFASVFAPDARAAARSLHARTSRVGVGFITSSSHCADHFARSGASGVRSLVDWVVERSAPQA
jgi:Fe-S oxidoreductase